MYDWRRHVKYTLIAVTGKPWSGKTTPRPWPVKTVFPAKFTFWMMYEPGIGSSGCAAEKEQRTNIVVARPIILVVSWTMVPILCNVPGLEKDLKTTLKASYIALANAWDSPSLLGLKVLVDPEWRSHSDSHTCDNATSLLSPRSSWI